jgi:hypothetical protein
MLEQKLERGFGEGAHIVGAIRHARFQRDRA